MCLRQRVRTARQALTSEQQQQHALRACQQFFSLPFWQQQTDKQLRIGVSLNFDGELNLTPIIEQLNQLGHRLYLPCLQPDYHLLFAHWRPHMPMKRNRYGVAEPTHQQRDAVDVLDVLLLPLVAVDRQGNRMGMGAGYYDRTLGSVSTRPYLIGVAHQLQLQEQTLPVQPWDVPLDALVTEEERIVWRDVA